MKLYVKQDGGFRYLGEGTLISKKNLILKEFTTGALSKETSNLTNGAQLAQKEINQSPGMTKVVASKDQVDGKTGNTGTQLNVNTRDPENIKQAQNIVNKSSESDNIDINYYDGNKSNPDGTSKSSSSLQVAHKVYSKRLIEMKKNSVPFTKKELNRYFKNL